MRKHPDTRPLIIPGFKFSAVSSGIKTSGQKDLALIYSEVAAVTSGLFTTNRIKAAPVKLAIERIRSRKGQAIVINSGNANACTGTRGIKDARDINLIAAGELGIPPELVYVSSTGIIGRPLPVAKIKKSLPGLVNELSPSFIHRAAGAIMTTDTFPKIYSKKIKIGKQTGTIAGFAKGAGMICPNMATMLCFIVTDIAVSPKTLDAALREAANMSFNRLAVDNDMSTNDTVMIMANGVLGNSPVRKNSVHFQKFRSALNDVTYNLAKMIALDGEGATKLIEIIVKGARTLTDAEKAAMAVAGSMLVKTAIYGRDPNWGRIMAAIGYSGAKINERTIDIYINKTRLVSGGTGTGKEKKAGNLFSDKEIRITIDLGAGNKTARALTCDLTENYIKINAHYST